MDLFSIRKVGRGQGMPQSVTVTKYKPPMVLFVDEDAAGDGNVFYMKYFIP